jgi:YQGE family putative transporter
MRNSRAVARVVTYQPSIYAATPLAFYLNGKVLARVGARHLYAAGMLLSGVAMILTMQLSILTSIGVATSGFTRGLATGLFWANRGFLALTATNNGNRNYYYGVEMFVATLASVIVPAHIRWFISGTTLYGWLGGVPNRAYHIVALAVFGLTAVVNTFLFNAVGVLVFLACLLLAKPLLDLAYYPIRFQVIDAVSRLESRNEYA